MNNQLSYDAIARIYDEDMGRNAGPDDVNFYVAQCRAAAGPVLELGCGTGRITLPLVQSGRSVAGIDSSQAMLERLSTKAKELSAPQQARLSWTLARMESFSFENRFARIICPYSAFTYLVEASDRRQALDNVRRHLEPGGTFVLDVFVPDPQIAGVSDGHVFRDYERVLADGTRLERTKTIQQDRSAKINVIKRTYSFFHNVDAMPHEQFTTIDRIRIYDPSDLRSVLET
ncbi:MAG: class I SAM-dependent methyltransferase, partial [Acidobacteriota bacterium]|nr:class I SAM-dependent methyltransferase [Acidobacteriota bacterium]